ncbi:DMT family transporter [Lacticaseibacillus sp. GG6-2]
MNKRQLGGHIAASMTILIWGTTFVSTKLLLVSFSPVTILLTRFVLGYAALWLCRPKRLHLARPRQEWWFVAAGLSGITVYYLLENIALTQTTASHVGVIVTISPFFTALLATLFLKSKRPSLWFYLGFVVAISGVMLISNPGSGHGGLLGDALAALAALAWAVYSILTTKIGEIATDVVVATRHVFFYGLVFMVPLALGVGVDLKLATLLQPVNLGNFLYLGLGACALCFVTWNIAVKRLGTVRSSVYIYLVPVVTLLFSAWILHEPLTWSLLCGAALTLVGLWLSSK